MNTKGLEMTSTLLMGRDDWLALRRNSIGGSDAAAIAGMSDYASPFSVYAEKIGIAREAEDNEAMRQGRDLEDYVARRWCDATGKKMSRCNFLLKNPAYPWAHANIDRQVVGENAGLECKTTTVLNTRIFKTGEFPEKYYCQCVHYLAVTGADRWYLAVLVLGREFHTYVLERDQEEIDALMAMEEEFWQHVQKREPPPADGMKATGDAIAAMYPETDNSTMELFGRDDLLEQLASVKAQIKSLDTQKDAIENVLKADIGNCRTATTARWKISWTPQSRRSLVKGFDLDKFLKDHPDVEAKEFIQTTESRVFRVTEIKKKG